MATIKDIAEKLGIAISTVSKGLNGAHDISDEMRQLVLDAAVEMGYASKKIKASNSKKVCVFLENKDYANIEQFGYDVIVGFKTSAARRNWEVTVIPVNLTRQTAEKYDTYMLKNGFSGSFVLGFTLHDDWIYQLSQTTVPTVLLDYYNEQNQNIGFVGTDYNEGIDQAVHHLSNLGHNKIAFLNGSKKSLISEQRYDAFINSLMKRGLSIYSDLIKYGHSQSDCAKDHVPHFVKSGATAILCASDVIASGVIKELSRLGLRVPEDISVIGYDDLPMASYTSPSLTTIRQERTDLGKSAFLLLDGLIHNVSTSKLLLRSKFIPRNSTAPRNEKKAALI